MNVMDNASVQAWIATAWQEALATQTTKDDPELDNILQSSYVSIRYCLVTQLLGKHADRRRDTLCLQRGSREDALEEGRWDPRSFCSSVVVPWVQNNNNVLGTSADPYASKPLRRPRLDQGWRALRGRQEWEDLVRILRRVESKNDPTYTEETLRRCLQSIVRTYNELNIDYPVPNRVSYADCLRVIELFLSDGSRGERPLVVASALLNILSSQFRLIDEIHSQGVNEADSIAQQPGDIMCYQRDEENDQRYLVYTIEVKDRPLTIVDVNSTVEKARRHRLTDVLFIVPRLHGSDEVAIETKVQEEWAKGTNIYYLPLEEFLRVVLLLPGDEVCRRLLTRIGSELDRVSLQPSHRAVWVDSLRSILS